VSRAVDGDPLSALRERLAPDLRARAPASDDAGAWLAALGADLGAAVATLSGAALANALDALVAAGEPAVAALERAEASARDREARKAIRRAMHRLRSRGVAVAEAREPGRRSVLRPLEETRERAFATPIDAAGLRLVWLLSEAPGRAEALEVLVSDEAGVVRVERLSGRRREAERLASGLLSDPKLGATELDAPAARAYLRRAERDRVAGPAPTADPALVREAVRGPDCPTPGEAVRVRVAPLASEAEAETLYRARVETGALLPWLLTGPELERTAAALDDAEQSPIVLSEIARRERREERFAAAAGELLGPAVRARLAVRLDESAALLAARGDEPGAGACLALADRVRAASDPLRVGFLRALLELSIGLARQKRAREAGGKLIVPR
jgi:hypothetical protein